MSILPSTYDLDILLRNQLQEFSAPTYELTTEENLLRWVENVANTGILGRQLIETAAVTFSCVSSMLPYLNGILHDRTAVTPMDVTYFPASQLRDKLRRKQTPSVTDIQGVIWVDRNCRLHILTHPSLTITTNGLWASVHENEGPVFALYSSKLFCPAPLPQTNFQSIQSVSGMPPSQPNEEPAPSPCSVSESTLEMDLFNTSSPASMNIPPNTTTLLRLDDTLSATLPEFDDLFSRSSTLDDDSTSSPYDISSVRSDFSDDISTPGLSEPALRSITHDTWRW